MPILSTEEQAFFLNQGVSKNALRAIKNRYGLRNECYRFIPQFIQQTSENIFKEVLRLHDGVPEFILSHDQSPEILNQLIQYGISMYELHVSVWNLDNFHRLYLNYNDFVRISQQTGIPFRRLYAYGMDYYMPHTLFDRGMLEKRDQDIFKYLCKEFGIQSELFDSLDEEKRAIVVDHNTGIYNVLIKSYMSNMRAVQPEEFPELLALNPALLRVILIHATAIQSFQESGISWKVFLNIDDRIRIHILENSWKVIQCMKHAIAIDSITSLNVLQFKQLLDLYDERGLDYHDNFAEAKDFIDTANLENSSAVLMRQVESQRIKRVNAQIPPTGLFRLPFEVREHILQFTGSKEMSENEKRQIILSSLTLC